MKKFDVSPQGVAERQRQLAARIRGQSQEVAGVLPDGRTQFERRVQQNWPVPNPADESIIITTMIEAIESIKDRALTIIELEKRLREDRSLSDEGRHRKFKNYVQEQINAAAKTADAARKLGVAESDKLKSGLPTLKKRKDFLTSEAVWLIETWRGLVQLPVLKLHSVFQDAIANSNENVFYSIVLAPKYPPLELPDELLEKGKHEFIRRQEPDQYARLAAVEHVLERLDTDAAAFITEASEHVQLRFSPAIVQPRTSPFPLVATG